MPKILLIEDDPVVCKNIETWLEFERCSVDVVGDGAEALSVLRDRQYDLIILDWELPSLNGIDVLRTFRSRGGQTPVLMLTGKDKIQDKELGFNVGTDDYLTKPFHPKELTGRLRALLRRPPVMTPSVMRMGNLELRLDEHRVLQNGDVLDLQPMEFTLLEFFMNHPGQVYSPDHLIQRVWPGNAEVSVNSVYVCIKRLRNKLKKDGDMLKTVRGVGYSFSAE